MKIDWKFWLTSILAILAIIIPYWLWQYDLRAKSLDISIISSASLQPEESIGGKEVSISVGGVKIDKPFITFIEITNNGSKPILASDFEGNLFLKNNGGRIMQGELGKTEPEQLSPAIKVAGQTIEISPLLLNPADKFSLSLITENGRPEFSVRARIAGISSVHMRTPASKSPWVGIIIKSIFAGIGMLLYFLFATAIFRRVRLTTAGAVIVSFYFASSATMLLSDALRTFEFGAIERISVAVVSLMTAALLVLVAKRKLNTALIQTVEMSQITPRAIK
jgi:hypothetical protein